ARRRASSTRTMPTCSPLGPTNRTSGTRIRSLMRGSLMLLLLSSVCPLPPPTRKGSPPIARSLTRARCRWTTGGHTRAEPHRDLRPGNHGGRRGWEARLLLRHRHEDDDRSPTTLTAPLPDPVISRSSVGRLRVTGDATTRSSDDGEAQPVHPGAQLTVGRQLLGDRRDEVLDGV